MVMHVPTWVWLAMLAAVLAMLAVDLAAHDQSCGGRGTLRQPFPRVGYVAPTIPFGIRRGLLLKHTPVPAAG